MPALTSQSDLVKEEIRHLSYPMYFSNALFVFKNLGVLALVIPKVPKRLKEWVYAGFGDFLFATIAIWQLMGLRCYHFFRLLILAILMVSFFYLLSIIPL